MTLFGFLLTVLVYALGVALGILIAEAVNAIIVSRIWRWLRNPSNFKDRP